MKPTVNGSSVYLGQMISCRRAPLDVLTKIIGGTDRSMHVCLYCEDICDVVTQLKFLLFHWIGHTKRCLQKNIEHFLCLSFCDMTVLLTYESQCFFSELITTL